MKTAMLPFNVELMYLDPQRLAAIKPVTSLDYYERADGNLHEDGLFSIGIFGRMGDEERDRRFSYIDIKVEVFHPIIYNILTKLKGMYRDIIAGKLYAVWSDEEQDFVSSTEFIGQTGYSFFVQHWRKINFSRNKSSIRDKRIDLIEKYKDRAMTSKILVMPAGLRDIEVDDNGQQKVGEINALYRKLLSISRTIVPSRDPNDPTYNLSRTMLQATFNEIYDTIERQLKDKRGFVQARWGSRRIFNGTRNVITAMDTSAAVLGDPSAPKYTDTVIGLFQAMKAFLPLAIHHLKNGYLNQVFGIGGGQARLIDPQTLEGVSVRLFSTTMDRWNTIEGLEKVISSFGEASLRNLPVMLDGYYLALIYLDEIDGKKVFKVIHDINDVPVELRDSKKIRPIQLDEILYLSFQDRFNMQAAMVTRYPVTGVGSCYPSTVYVKTTIVGEKRTELNSEWRVDAHCREYLEFPRADKFSYLDTMVIPSSRLSGLGADFDGDMSSFSSIYTDEAVKEIHDHLKTKQAYVDPRGGLKASVAVHTVNLVLRNMTG